MQNTDVTSVASTKHIVRQITVLVVQLVPTAHVYFS